MALITVSVLFSLAALELGYRLLTMGPQSLVQWPNLARQMMNDTDDGDGGCAYLHDATLGWSLRPNCTSTGFNVGPDGFRVSPAATKLAEPPVLATGSSFTVGVEVGDGETWPSYLQDQTGRKVVNAGVSGYSLDQSVLNTEKLVPQVKPLLVVLSFTPGDVWRNELSVAYSREKPALVVTGRGDLALSNVPIPPRSRPFLPVVARWLGWSAVAREVVERLGIRDGWYYDETRATPPGTGDTISCLLMPRLAKLGVPVMVVAQYGRGYWGADAPYKSRAIGASRNVLACAEKAGLVALDLAPPLEAAIKARGLDVLFQSEHQSAEGNRVVAELIRHELERRKLLPATATQAD
jgi:hypothetical protein